MVSGVIGLPVSVSLRPKVLKYTCRPCCLISTIAPGIFPVATSLLKKSSMRPSFSGEKTAGFAAASSVRAGAAPKAVSKTAASNAA